MKRIVDEHYPVADLPADLREGFDLDGYVRITIEFDDSKAAAGAPDKQDDVNAAPDA